MATTELKIGSDFWARQVTGHYGPGGDPLDFTVIGETKTLWKVRRTSHPEVVTNLKKDGSEWMPLPTEDAKKILWLRANANNIEKSLHSLVRNAYEGSVDVSIYDTLKAIAALLNYEPAATGKAG